ncbi:hypothetical protein TBLA_0H01440 [Henningerozyma blattae CBS 6284]|uniref:tRNA (guanine(26)-N(2))-dimethyltransferase n=1 Tax=Henningerozyma blattae (strain ATCC 34711 / CBS 6284 / DSM 70876 / NBRC 10599 / NRRL Y-10934 / UCD 77-7) TaxID=1071380 RepID=I2H7S9_HENB6|nr:hypothetical protein TBLA_0H01440 [Tetrapisispora blattae CBS 6284]CCH62431.1 hypothetical protein TBLA_0H01440 [Tetrapisispora blattae CBS 6284]
MLKAVTSIKNKLISLKNLNSKISPDDYNIIKEGRAEILFPKEETVFYNPIQQFNRDLSVTCIKAWNNLYGPKAKNNRKTVIKPSHKRANEDSDSDDQTSIKHRKLEDGSVQVETFVHRKPYLKILEALSATGLRAIRYAKEIPNVKEIVANDLLPEAVESIRRNAQYNNVLDIVKPNQDDANVLMYRNKAQNKKYHIIDLDPYGTVTPFVDAAFQNIEDDGLMLVTCTDLSVLAGNGYPEKCFALYGGVNMISHEATHESALRLVLNLLGQTAAKYKKSIEPLLSLSIDFYVRVFIKVKTSPIKVKDLQSNTMITYHCSNCGSFANQPLGRKSEKVGKKSSKPYVKFAPASGPPVNEKCQFCDGTFHLAGPMYAGSLHNDEFVKEVLRINKEEHSKKKEFEGVYGTTKRIEGMVTLAAQELKDAPFYFSPNNVSSIIKLQVPPLKRIVAGLGSLGYQSSLSHAKHSCLKTNAPWEAIWYVMRESQKIDFPDIDMNKKLSKMNKNTAGYKILSKMNEWLPKEEDSIAKENKNADEKPKKDYGEIDYSRKNNSFDITKLSFEPNEQSNKVEGLRHLKMVRYQENPTKNWGPKARPNSS